MDGSVLEAVRATGLLAAGRRHVVLVSGGRDSVCLLDVAAAICTPGAITALHVNYGLRGEDSDADERHVRDLCERLGVALEVHAAPAPPRPGNLQAWARDLRYAHATALAGADAAIATGHTASDQAETILYRLAASPGRRALLGMAPAEGRLRRPLLALTREQTAAHCRARGLSWREDASNDDRDRFARARVRHGVLPALREVHPAAERNLLRTAELLRAEAEVLAEVVATALAGRDRIALTRLRELPPALARLVVIRLAEDAAGTPAAHAGSRLGDLLELGARGGSAALDLGGGVRAVAEYGVLRFERPDAGAAAPPDTELAIPGEATFGTWAVSASLQAQAPSGGEQALLDADRLGSSLTVRAWRHGDRMRPAGLGGAKAVSDLFGERRIPRAQRALLPLFTSEGEIAWIPGVAIAEGLRAQPTTRRVAALRARGGGARQ